MRAILTIGFAWLSILCLAQGSSFKASTDKESILIGEQVLLRLEIRSAAADSVSFPILEDTINASVEIVRQSPIDTTFEGQSLEQRVLSQELVLTSFDSGYHAIPPLTAMVNGFPVESNPFLVTVQTVPVDTAKGIYDIRGVAQVPFSFMEWFKENWSWLALIAIVILGIIGLIVWLKRRPRSIPIVIEAPKRPAHELAFERLDQLESKSLWQNDKVKEFYSELTDILREYIELRYSIPALEQTTDEIIDSMRRKPDFGQETIEKTRNVLFLADLVKFAKEKPVGTENEMNLAAVRLFIEETKVSPPTNNTSNA